MHFAALAVISIHALREEGDPEPDSCDCEFVVFLSTPSARRATELHSFRQGQSEISIHALREEGDRGHPGRRAGEGISIHALREEGDAKTTLDRGHRHKFLSTPSARRATAARIAAYKGWVFLSTPSARRATWSLWMRWNHPQNFYPRPPRGGRPLPRWLHLWRGGNFYPRPPRGGRPKDGGIVVGTVTFLSTPSARRATGLPVREAQRRPISIHALREEGDAAFEAGYGFMPISIHALREEGDSSTTMRSFWLKLFLSTPSARRATGRREPPQTCTGISIHALREEGDHEFCGSHAAVV